MVSFGMEPTAYVLKEWLSIPSLVHAPTATHKIELLLMENADAHLPTTLPPLPAALASPTVHTILLPKPVYVSQIMRYLTANAY